MFLLQNKNDETLLFSLFVTIYFFFFPGPKKKNSICFCFRRWQMIVPNKTTANRTRQRGRRCTATKKTDKWIMGRRPLFFVTVTCVFFRSSLVSCHPFSPRFIFQFTPDFPQKTLQNLILPDSVDCCDWIHFLAHIWLEGRRHLAFIDALNMPA